MRDAMGGSVVLIIIVMFIVIALGYMAFNVNYTKAFRMKNKVISVYEEYDGECLSECKKKIKDYSKSIGYTSANGFKCPSGYTSVDNIYCVKSMQEYATRSDDVVQEGKTKYYYRIITKITVEIPIINNILDLNVFHITGDTKSFEKDLRG